MNKPIWIDPFLVEVQLYEEGKFDLMKEHYNSLSKIDKIRISLQCIEKNIYGINATVRVGIAATLLSSNV